MKPNATYKCGHQSNKSFDCRNVNDRYAAERWPKMASQQECPSCRRTAIEARIDMMTTEELRRTLKDLAGVKSVAIAIENRCEMAET